MSEALISRLKLKKRRTSKRDKPHKKDGQRNGMNFRVSVCLYGLALVMFFFGLFQSFISYLVAMILHEMAHAEAARRLGYTLNHFKLMPYGAALIGEFEGSTSRDEIRIALAGPMVSAALCVLSVAAMALIPQLGFFCDEFILANLFLAAVNLLPIFPLDGGRILLAALSYKTPRQRAYRFVRVLGFIMVGVFGALFILSFFYGLNLSLLLMALFILFSTVFPDKHSRYQQLYRLAYRAERIRRHGLTVREVMITEDTRASALFKKISIDRYTRFIVTDSGLNRLFVIEETMLESLSAGQYIEPVGKLRQNFDKFRQN